MTKGKAWEKKNPWWILLGVLCVVIVGLGIGIGVIISNSKSSEQVSLSDEEILNSILQSIAPMNIEDTQEYLDEQLDIYSGTDLEQRIKMMKLNAFVNAGFFEDAIIESSNIDDKLLSDSERLNFYSAVNKAYIAIGDVDNADYYEKKFIDLYYEIVGEEGNFYGL